VRQSEGSEWKEKEGKFQKGKKVEEQKRKSKRGEKWLEEKNFQQLHPTRCPKERVRRERTSGWLFWQALTKRFSDSS
jgi:hypothetical protein